MDKDSKNYISDSEDVFDDVSTDYDSDKTPIQSDESDTFAHSNVSLSEWLYRNISILGLQTKRYAKRFALKIFVFILIPAAYLAGLIKIFFKAVKKLINDSHKTIKQEARSFSADVKAAGKLFRINKKADDDERNNPFAMMFSFIKTAFKKHSSFLKHSASYILPVAALIVSAFVINYLMNRDFALEVTYNNVNIGYIQSEKVFTDAKEILEQRLEIGGQEYSTDVVSDPEYKISVVNLNELSDSNEICEQIIENSDSGLTTACGVYIDNKFIGSVKNEIDASSVFKSIVSDYCRVNGINQNDSKLMVDIVEEVSYIQGLYSERTLMDSNELKEYISEQNKSEISKYTFKESDTPYSVSSANGLTLEQFYALNPDIKQGEEIKKDTKVNIIKSIPFINIKVSQTQTVTKELKYKTVEIKTNALYSGVKKTISKGQNGEQKVVNLITYVNGVKVSEKAISSTVTKEPVDEKVYIGTKPVPSYVKVYGVNSGTFIWPVVGANYVTSGFGYRSLFGSTSFHRGIDISGAGASGKPVIASAAGTVEKVTSSNTGYGYSVLINHGNGIKTRYAHLLADSITVNVGDPVAQGQMIAQLGSTGNSTGPHLHFEIIYNGSYANPLDYVTR
ncbi:MAG: peptidoglycan DD-metalloendopeptidase family protein [Acutalibacteraceae bacterium]